MRPYGHLRKARGYCCRWCDGSLKQWKKKHGRSLRKRDRRIAKKFVEVESIHEENN